MLGSDSSKRIDLSEVPRMSQLMSPAKAQFRSFRRRLSSRDLKLEQHLAKDVNDAIERRSQGK